ncbi:MAG: hypothetical protein D6741_11190 [Planctomycetota bacterium]|nr:MAG: hypothetical protein D6741_11190 [Planctomycetota bacterium]
MFGFLLRKKREAVRRFLSRRLNERVMRSVPDCHGRFDSRSAFCEVIWIVPFDAVEKRPDYSQAFAAVSRDLSAEGASFVRDEPLAADRVLLGIRGDYGWEFLRSDVEHNTPIGYGFYLVGIRAIEPFRVDPCIVDELEQRLGEPNRQAEPALAGC